MDGTDDAASADLERLHVALVAPPLLPIPSPGYAGTERVIAALGGELHRRGHEVTLFAPGDSVVPYELVPTVPRALWPAGGEGGESGWFLRSAGLVARLADRFDVIHSHLELFGLPLARHARTPVVTTFHGRLDTCGAPATLDEFAEVPLVAISGSQRRWSPRARWVATIPHGLAFDGVPLVTPGGDYLALVGRMSPEKGVAEAIQLARVAGLPLRIAGRVRGPDERAYFEQFVRPAIADRTVEFLGEVTGPERDQLMAGAMATLMLGAWPEPFGLVAIESMATGTPLIARRAGALPEIVEHGVDGFLVDDLPEAAFALTRVGRLDRGLIARRARTRFSVGRMVDRYEATYRSLIGAQQASLPREGGGLRPATPVPIPVGSRRMGRRPMAAGAGRAS